MNFSIILFISIHLDYIQLENICGAIIVRVVSVVVWSQMIVACVDQMDCVWVDRLMVDLMGDTDCVCEEACGVCVSVLGVIQVNVQRWG
jgi:hypothetical protein